ncbi:MULTISPECIES: DUF982 domain-containing protein [unclassified Mesorhizobium]|uniref:DUF982 domain-containing protein n=1 Tax=unclassified Mesorhizobium TaxID=325217 RepID=UPI00112612B4|nr:MULTISPECIES: DUF982 domain-containing protein [unclassified Mesorhizobium]MBZ9701727.1 DUF982 domain-containing protein [Mesorhizobium sp. CO1-1-3]MBZ9949075.1 DUF982 domain-containing protein [Mesorhizobium sp. BR1-1-11]TPI99713.1 DUF982 domain-containing protein [Mesorhizobium sp. B2-8-1]
MATHWFSPPVPVSGKQSGMIYIVSNVEAAAEHLFSWTKRGPKWNQAVRTCMHALVDQASPREAREAFLAAAREAGVLRAN